jgi:spore coat polysaccharide biosynthesis predicted glycosyltransferase SpsG
MGDVTGSLAIADEFKRRRHNITFIVDRDPEAQMAIRNRGYRFIPVIGKSESRAWGRRHFDIAIVNQMSNTLDLLKCAKAHCNMLVTIDDTGTASKKMADLRINPLYYTAGALCDPKYIPLETDFQKAHRNRQVCRKVKKVLVTMGGSDTYGYTPQILPVISKNAGGCEIAVIIGPAFKHHKELNSALAKAGRKFSVLHAVTHKEMKKWILWADLAICAGGNTLFEMACCGTPAVVIASEPFEEETAYRLAKTGFGKVVGFNKKLDAAKLRRYMREFAAVRERSRHSKAGMRLVKGLGTVHIVDSIVKRHRQATNGNK